MISISDPNQMRKEGEDTHASEILDTAAKKKKRFMPMILLKKKNAKKDTESATQQDSKE